MSFLKTFLLLVVLIAAWNRALSQTVYPVAETASYTDYVFRNDSLKYRTPLSLLAGRRDGYPSYELRKAVYVPARKTDAATRFFASTDNQTSVALVNPGTFRKMDVVTVELRVVKDGGLNIQILKEAEIRVFKPLARTAKNKQVSRQDSPFATGEWYKIPVSATGIYQLNRQYLVNLGVNLDRLDPRNLQIWGTDGFELPARNDQSRPVLVEIPIIVEGEQDGRFDNADRVVFFQNGPHRVFYQSTAQRFEHRTHHASNRNFVFLHIGTSAGRRLTKETAQSAPSGDVSTFTDFSWKEEERQKPEADIKSGSQWLGQSLSVQTSGFTTVHTDTFPGFTSGQVTLQFNVANRSLGNSARFVFFTNGTAADSINVFSIDDFTGVLGLAARAATRSFTTAVSAQNGIIQTGIRFNHTNSFSSTGFVDFVRIWVERPLIAKNNRLVVYENRGTGAAIRYRFQGFSQEPFVFDVTNPQEPVWLSTISDNGTYAITTAQVPGKILAAQNALFTPAAGIKLQNQNLHGTALNPGLVIVTAEPLLEKAQQYASWRAQKSSISTVVVTQEAIFNEFSGGLPDYVAIRDYLKYLYDSAPTTGLLPKYLLLFGDATFDYKGIEAGTRKNLVFTFQTRESNDRIYSYGSDDFFGLLDDNEGNWDGNPFSNTERVDVGIGRFPVQTEAEADILIKKIQAYEDPSNFGDWRTVFTFVSDDDVSGSRNDTDLHLINADVVAESINQDGSGLRLQKIHTLNYQALTTSQGRRFPDATNDIVAAVNRGTLLLSYSGHGNESTLSDEKLFDVEYLNRFTNRDRLSIFVTATCSFGRFDDNEAQSGAEETVMLPDAGMVASFTTTRTVFTSRTPGNDNFGLNLDLTESMTSRPVNGGTKTLGEIYLDTKNASPGASPNGRKFILIGDPAMRFGLPSRRAVIDSINGTAATGASVVLNALQEVRVSGFAGGSGADPLFNGNLVLTVFDGVRSVKYAEKSWTEGYCQFADCTFLVQNDVLFKGQATVRNGRFSASFIVPKDIQFSSSNGRIHLYAFNGESDASGGYSTVQFNGVNAGAVNDGTGPSIHAYFNDSTFTDGGLVNNKALLYVKLQDASGINTAGSGVGHELTATLSTLPEKVLSLNEGYVSTADSYRSGVATVELPDLTPGPYSATIRAWDVFNNVSEQQIRFTVGESAGLQLKNVYNYPNPMSRYTRFVFEHNLPAGTPVSMRVRIFTLSGRPVQVLEQTTVTSGNIQQLGWDGSDADGKTLANGTYLYHISLQAEPAEGPVRNQKTEKLVIIR